MVQDTHSISILLAILWGVQLYMVIFFFKTWKHAVLGQVFLMFANMQFKNKGKSELFNVSITNTLVAAHVGKISKFRLFIAVTNTMVCMCLFSIVNLDELSEFIFAVECLFSGTFAYMIIATWRSFLERNVINIMCNSTDEQLQELGIDDAYIQALKEFGVTHLHK